MIAAIIKFPQKVCAMCGRPATHSIELVDSWGQDMGEKQMCAAYPWCVPPSALPLVADLDLGRGDEK